VLREVGVVTATRAEVLELLEAVLTERDLAPEQPRPGHLVVTLPGVRKQKVVVNFIVGEHALRVESFLMRHPEENHQQVYAWMLRRNARMYGVAFSIDAAGDVYLTGRVALGSLTDDEIDRLLGVVLEYADGSFNRLLELGYASAIRREWAWRVSRGESLANLEAFAGWAADPPVGSDAALAGGAGGEVPEGGERPD
jgi:hypothetical protein